ncbi:MAG: hypothetical protein K2X47_05140, partial [Bdellovibrionales bacterium]|nr:hypothetical protein [Bdellovibrionales bacterium]
MSQQIVAYFAKFIQQELGIIYSDHNWFQLENRLQEIVKHLELSGLEEFYQVAQRGMQESHRQLLLDIATNNETSFFRDPKIFTAIHNTVIPTILKTLSTTDTINIWSAAGSTGQEALSVAMQFEEFAQLHKLPVRFQILMTDISERVLKKAQSATYSQLELDRGLPLSLR